MGKGISVMRMLTATVYQMRTTIVHSGRRKLRSSRAFKQFFKKKKICQIPGGRGGGREVLSVWTCSFTVFVQRSSGTIAGQGYLEVSLDCLFGGWNVRTVNTYWGE
jgi:hypothetical protein